MAVFWQTSSFPAFETGLFDGPVTDEALPDHPEHLLGGDNQQAEGQVRRHLDWTAHADMPSPVLFVQPQSQTVGQIGQNVPWGQARMSHGVVIRHRTFMSLLLSLPASVMHAV